MVVALNVTPTQKPKIWEVYGLRSNPFSTNPLLVIGGNIPIDSFFGRAQELKQLEGLILNNSNSRVLVYGDIGIGKTTLANYVRWSLFSKNNYFTPFPEIGVQEDWDVNDFILNSIGAIYDTINLITGLAEKLEPMTLVQMETLVGTRRGEGEGFSGSAAGFGAGHQKSTSVGTPQLTTTNLTNLFRKIIAELKNLGFEGVIIHYNNLELIRERGEKRFKYIFQGIRDFIQTDGVHFIFVGDLTVYPLFQSIPRLEQTFHSPPIYLQSFKLREIWAIINKRIRALSIAKVNSVNPVTEEAVKLLFELYSGNIRSIFRSLSAAVTNSATARTIVFTEDMVKNSLSDQAKNRYLPHLNNSEKKILNRMLQTKEITNTKLAKYFQMKPQNISNILKKLKEVGCIRLSRISGREKFYVVSAPVKWLLLAPADINQKQIIEYF